MAGDGVPVGDMALEVLAVDVAQRTQAHEKGIAVVGAELVTVGTFRGWLGARLAKR